MDDATEISGALLWSCLNTTLFIDRVAVGNGKYSEIFSFTRGIAQFISQFVHIELESGNFLQLSSSHYLYVNDENNLVPASKVKLGDVLFLADGTANNVVQISIVLKSGLYNPQTLHGDILVNDISSSTYTELYTSPAAHTLLALLRLLYNAFGFSTTAFASAAEKIVS